MRCMCIRFFNEGRYLIFLMNVDYPRCWFHLLEVFIVVANGYSKMRVHLHSSISSTTTDLSLNSIPLSLISSY